EATNKTLLRILSKMVYEYEGGWSVHLPDALWAYRTSPRSATGFSPYSLVYGSDAISPVEITVPTARIAAVNDLEWDTKACSEWRLLDLEALDEKRAEAEKRTTMYHRTCRDLPSLHHNGKARLQSKRFTVAAIIAWSPSKKAR
ncbi:unnamed protein product, partial [Prunus brigantina]